MNILSIYPEFPDTFWSIKHALKLAYQKASSPPLGLLRDYPSPKIRSALSFRYKLALFYSIYRLGLPGKERLYFWRVMFWTLFRRPRLFPLAVTLTIYG